MQGTATRANDLLRYLGIRQSQILVGLGEGFDGPDVVAQFPDWQRNSNSRAQYPLRVFFGGAILSIEWTFGQMLGTSCGSRFRVRRKC